MSTIVTPIYGVSTHEKGLYFWLTTENIAQNGPYVCSIFWIFIGFNVDPDPACHLNADPEPGIKPMRIHADPYPVSWSTSDKFLAPGPGFLKRIQIRIQETKSMRIHADTDPQHWYVGMLSRYIPQSIYFFF
jgi:hypothetical protein